MGPETWVDGTGRPAGIYRRCGHGARPYASSAISAQPMAAPVAQTATTEIAFSGVIRPSA